MCDLHHAVIVYRIPVAEHIDIEYLPQILVASGENCMRSKYACVVDEDRGRTKSCFDFLRRGVNRRSIGNVAGEELDIRI